MTLAVFRYETDTLRHGRTGGIDADLLAVEPDFGIVLARVAAEDGHRQFSAAGAHETGDAEDLTLAQLERNVIDAFARRVVHVEAGDVLRFEEDVADRVFFAREEVLDFAPDHHRNDVVRV